MSMGQPGFVDGGFRMSEPRWLIRPRRVHCSGFGLLLMATSRVHVRQPSAVRGGCVEWLRTAKLLGDRPEMMEMAAS